MSISQWEINKICRFLIYNSCLRISLRDFLSYNSRRFFREIYKSRMFILLRMGLFLFYKNCHFLTENSTDLVIFSWDLFISHQQQYVSLNSCHYCQELLFSVCQMRNQQFSLLTNLVEYLNDNVDNVDFWIVWL